MKKPLLLLAMFSFNAYAETPPVVVQAPEPPVTVLPTDGLEDDELEPQVNIIRRDDAVVHEYRMNGTLYMIKVIPVVGPAYYLIDSNGDGTLNARRSELDPGLVVPSWMIFRW
ncbi:MAG TPA: DUF2782 domain-containing protein [Gammaproteobacteria bacterium]|jgi:hypothetical protein|nr:DUF2782 domain-containing protein [Gammaproteobacteria bacterium]